MKLAAKAAISAAILGALCLVGQISQYPAKSADAGTVTSVGFTGGLVSVANPTTTPNLTVAGTSGGIPYFSGASTWDTSAALTAHGVVIGGGAATAPTSTSAGTAGRVLTSNGASADPTFQLGGLTLLEQHTFSGASASAFTSCISSSFDDYVIKMIGIVPSTSGVKIGLQFSTNGGSSYDSGAHYSWNSFVMVRSTQGPNGADSATVMNLVNEVYTAGASGSAISMDGTFELFHPASTTLWATVVGQASTAINSGGTEPANWTMQGAYTVTGSAVNAFQVIPSAGTISGTVRCYGAAK